MTRTKKLLIILLLAIVAISIIPFNVNAAETATLSLDSKEVAQGQEVTVEMKLAGSITAEDITEAVVFNKAKLEVVKIEKGAVLNNAQGLVMYSEVARANENGEVGVTVANSEAQTFNAGVILKITFKPKAGAAGDQVLTLRTEDSGVKTVNGAIKVVVPITGIELDRVATNVGVGETVTITATVKPDTTTASKVVTWESSDNSVATVNNGAVKALKEGTATITAKTADGKFAATCKVTVECKHTAKTTHAAVPSTCVVQGNAQYTTCNACGKVIDGSDAKLPLAAHTYGELIAEVPMVHTQEKLENGTKAHYECSVCKKLFGEDKKEVSAEDLVIKAEHKYGDFIITEETHTTKCEECGKVIKDEKHKGGIAYCMEKAICEVCKAQYGEIDPENHKGGEATCVAKAVCELCKKEYGEIDPDNHVNTELINYVEPTTEKEGYSGDVYCKDCEKTVEKGEVIAKLEKDPEKEENQDPNKPKTADNSHIMLWISLSLVAMIGVVYVVKHNKKA